MRRFVLAQFVAPVILLATPALSQPPLAADNDPTEKAVRDKATALYNDGVKFADSNDWAQAYSSYAIAYRLWHQYMIAANLGEVELRLGKYRDAAEHLSVSLRRVSAEPKLAKERAKIEGELEDAARHVGRVAVHMDTAGADVVVDGKTVGRTPLEGPLFVEPGSRTFEARLGDKASDARALNVAAGTSTDLSLSFAARPPTAPSASSSATVEPSPGRDHAEVTATQPSRSIVPVVITGSLAAAALTFGIVFSAEAGSKEDERTSLVSSLGSGSACGPGSPNPAACNRVQQLADDRVADRNLATGGFIAAGVSAAATVYFLLQRSQPSQVVVVPSVSTQHASLNLSTTF